MPGTGVGHCDLRAAIPHPRPGPEAQHPLRWQCSPGQLSSALPSESLFSLSGACQSGDSATKAFAVDFSMDVAPSPGSLPNGTATFPTSTRTVHSVYLSPRHVVSDASSVPSSLGSGHEGASS